MVLALVLFDLLFPKILKALQNVELRRYALAPAIDFLNHSSNVSTAANVAYEYFLDRFVVRSRQDYECGEQVFISYGEQSNDSLLQYYGFVDDHNPSDDYVFGEEVENFLKVSPGTLRVLANGKFSDPTIVEISKAFGGGEKKIGQVLANLCHQELDRFKTTVEEDTQLLKARKLTRQHEIAIRYRIGKKNILKEAQKYQEQLLQKNS